MKSTLLIVDDDALLCRGTQRIFNRLGWTTLTATSVPDALRLLPQADIVLSDWEMPGGGGNAILKAAKVPVVILTGSSDAIPHPFVLRKPETADRLVETLEEALVINQRGSKR